MPKIKNWSKASETRGMIMYTSDNGAALSVEKSTQRGTWKVLFRPAPMETNRGGTLHRDFRLLDDVQAMFNTKKEAKKAAVEWMRNHPKA